MPPKPTVLAILVVLLLVGGCVSAERVREAPGPKPVPTSFELGPGVIVEGDGSAVFVMDPGGGVVAVDTRSGGAVWRTDAAAKPLALTGRRLVAQGEATRPGVLPIVILDTSDDGQPALKVEIPLPAGALAVVDQPLGVSFSTSAWADGRDVVIEWNYLEQEVSAVAPPPGTPPIRQRFAGAARLDPASGTVQALSAAPVPELPPLPPPVQRMVDDGKLPQPPWRTNGVLAAVAEQVAENGNRNVILRRWSAETGEALPDVMLFEGRPRAVLPSADDRHLVITSRLEDTEAPAWERYRWSIFSLASGADLGDMRWHTSATAFCVVDGTLLTMTQPFERRIEGRVVDEPPAVRAVSLESGTRTWNHPVRDTAYRGPYPAGP